MFVLPCRRVGIIAVVSWDRPLLFRNELSLLVVILNEQLCVWEKQSGVLCGL
jgi:hypothetical protein